MSSWIWGIAIGIPAVIGCVVAALPWLVRPMMRCLLWPRYSFRVMGLEHLPRTGPVLLASNHVTWIDGFFLVAVIPRRGRALVNADFVNRPVIRWITRRAGIIPVPFSGPHAVRKAISSAQEALDQGSVVLMFPEAQLTRTGLLGPFYRGLEAILKGREQVPVIPIHLDHVWGSLFSHSKDRFFLKWPQGFRRTVFVAFGPPVPPPRTTFAVRQAILEAGTRALTSWGVEPPRLETVDGSLPHWCHPTLGLLSVSIPNFERGGIRQTGSKPGTVGQAAPGVTIRAVGGDGAPLQVDAEGSLQALTPGQSDWTDTGRRGSVDRDGFIRLADQE